MDIRLRMFIDIFKRKEQNLYQVGRAGLWRGANVGPNYVARERMVSLQIRYFLYIFLN